MRAIAHPALRAAAAAVMSVAAASCGGAGPSATTAPPAATATATNTPTPTAAATATLPPSPAPATPSPTISLPEPIDLAAIGVRFEIGPEPDFAVAARDDLYVGGVGAGLARVLPDGTVGADWAIPGDQCAAMDVGFGAVWTETCSAPGLARIDTKTGKLTTASLPGVLPDSESSIGVGEGAVWVVRQTIGPRQLVKVDPDTLEVVGTYPLQGTAVAVRAGEGGVWIADPTRNTVTRFDPATEAVVATIEVGRRPQFLAVGSGGVFTMNQIDGTVSHIDPATNSVVATIAVGEQVAGGDIIADVGAVWLRGSSTLLFEIDPIVDRVVAVYGPPSGSGSVAVGRTALWVTAHDTRSVWRVALIDLPLQ